MSIWKDFLNWVHDLGHDTLDFITPLAKEIAKSGGTILMEAAYDAVKAAEAAGGSGKDKFAAAETTVIADLTTKGIPIVLNAVHGAIESAVAKLRA